MIEIEWDQDGYPTDETIKRLSEGTKSQTECCEFLASLPEQLESCIYANVTTCIMEQDESFEICVSTGGWSGVEAIIGEIRKWPLCNLMYFYAWQRGGHFTWRIPIRFAPDWNKTEPEHAK